MYRRVQIVSMETLETINVLLVLQGVQLVQEDWLLNASHVMLMEQTSIIK